VNARRHKAGAVAGEFLKTWTGVICASNDASLARAPFH